MKVLIRVKVESWTENLLKRFTTQPNGSINHFISLIDGAIGGVVKHFKRFSARTQGLKIQTSLHLDWLFVWTGPPKCCYPT